MQGSGGGGGGDSKPRPNCSIVGLISLKGTTRYVSSYSRLYPNRTFKNPINRRLTEVLSLGKKPRMHRGAQAFQSVLIIVYRSTHLTSYYFITAPETGATDTEHLFFLPLILQDLESVLWEALNYSFARLVAAS